MCVWLILNWSAEKPVGLKLTRIMWQYCKLIDSVMCDIVRFRCVQRFRNALSGAIKHWLWNACVHAMQAHCYNYCRWLCSAQMTMVGVLSKRSNNFNCTMQCNTWSAFFHIALWVFVYTGTSCSFTVTSGALFLFRHCFISIAIYDTFLRFI